MDIAPHRITDIQSSIINKIADTLQTGNITEDQLPEIAEFVLENTKKITTEEELLAFLKSLAKEWPFFEPVEGLEERRAKEELEEEIITDVLQLAKNGKIEEAVNLAKKTTH